MTTEEKKRPQNKAINKKSGKKNTSTIGMSKTELESELHGLLAMAKSKENLSSAVAILKLIRELEANEQAAQLKAHWLDELMGMSDADLERRIRSELAVFTTGKHAKRVAKA